jgi:hypothetical protein
MGFLKLRGFFASKAETPTAFFNKTSSAVLYPLSFVLRQELSANPLTLKSSNLLNF